MTQDTQTDSQAFGNFSKHGNCESHRIYYHVAALGHWREILSEQLRLIAALPLGEKVYIGFTGAAHEAGYIWRTADTFGIECEIMFQGSGNANYEFPTLDRLHAACLAYECQKVIYLHTKGASRIGDWSGIMWRWFMNAYMLTERRMALKALNQGDWCAPVISGGLGDGILHPVGNFWGANAEHIRRLVTPSQMRHSFTSLRQVLKSPDWIHERHAAEMWIATVSATAVQLHRDEDCDISQHDWWCRRTDMQVFATKYGS